MDPTRRRMCVSVEGPHTISNRIKKRKKEKPVGFETFEMTSMVHDWVETVELANVVLHPLYFFLFNHTENLFFVLPTSGKSTESKKRERVCVCVDRTKSASYYESQGYRDKFSRSRFYSANVIYWVIKLNSETHMSYFIISVKRIRDPERFYVSNALRVATKTKLHRIEIYKRMDIWWEKKLMGMCVW